MKVKNSTLKIIVYGKTALDDIIYINESLKKKEFYKNNVDKLEYSTTFDNITNFEYITFQTEIKAQANESIKNLLIEHFKNENLMKVEEEIKKVQYKFKESNIEEINEILTDVLSKVKRFNDILIIIVDNLLDEDSKLAFDYFHKISENKSQQPFMLFLTKNDNNPKILDLFQYITNTFFDKRNLFAFKYPTNTEEIEKIKDFFYKCFNYYNEIGNIKTNQPKKTFDILLCGRKGTGKSTFVNQILEEKVAKESSGLSRTFKINSYNHPKYPFRIFDTPGWGNEGADIILKKLLQNENFIEKISYNFELILIFFDCKINSFIHIEIDIIRYLLENRKKIIFVLNEFGTLSKKEKYRLISIFKDSISTIIHTFDKNIFLNTDEIFSNIVLIKLHQSFIECDDEDDDEDQKIIIKQCYGMDDLFNKINDIFKIHLISINELKCACDFNELIKSISKYYLLNQVQRIEEILINIKINCSKIILSYSKEDFYVLFLKDTRRKELLIEINKQFNNKPIKDIDKLYSELDNQINYITDKKIIISEFFESIARFRGYFEIGNFDFNAYFYNEHTLLIGAIYLKRFETELGYFDEKTNIYLENLSSALNESIHDFRYLSNDWKEIYKCLRLHKSHKEWVNRYFVVEKYK